MIARLIIEFKQYIDKKYTFNMIIYYELLCFQTIKKMMIYDILI